MQSRSAPTPKPEKKLTPIHPDKLSEVKLASTDSKIKDFTVVLMVSPGGEPSQQTICRPIGTVPGTDGASYVMMQSSNVKTFDANRENPLKKAADLIMSQARDKFYISQKLYEVKEGKTYFQGRLVADIWKEATLKREAHLKELKTKFLESERAAGRFPVGTAENPKGEKKKTIRAFKPPSLPVVDFLEENFKKKYTVVHDAWMDSKESAAAQKAYDSKLAEFETTGGPDGFTQQHHLAWLRGVPPNLVKMYLYRVMIDPVNTVAEIHSKYGTSSAASV